jgi:hypothetical protein
MDNLIHRSPSVGGVIKKMLAINPNLGADQIIDFIRKSTFKQEQSGVAGEFAQAEVIDEKLALSMATATLPRPRDRLSLVRGPS